MVDYFDVIMFAFGGWGNGFGFGGNGGANSPGLQGLLHAPTSMRDLR